MAMLSLENHAAKSLQSCPTLCDPIDGIPPGSPIPGILQARTLEWVAISFSNAWKWKVKVKSLSHDRILAIPWTAAYQAPPSMGFSRQEYWSGVPLPSPWKTMTVPLFTGPSKNHLAFIQQTILLFLPLVKYLLRYTSQCTFPWKAEECVLGQSSQCALKLYHKVHLWSYIPS